MIDRYIERVENIIDVVYAFASEETFDGFLRALYEAGYVIVSLEDLRK